MSSYSTITPSSPVYNGYCLSWDVSRGFGFLRATSCVSSPLPLDSQPLSLPSDPNEPPDRDRVFCHHSSLRLHPPTPLNSVRALSPSSLVQFSLVSEGPGKWKAKDVREQGGGKLQHQPQHAQTHGNDKISNNPHRNNATDETLPPIRMYSGLAYIEIDGLILHGISTAGKYTSLNCYHTSNHKMNVMMDLGNIFHDSIVKCSLVLLSHCHLDHCNSIISHSHLRELTNMTASTYIVPLPSIHKFNEFFMAAERLSTGNLPRKLIGVPLASASSFCHQITSGYKLYTFPTYHRVPSIGYYVVETKYTLKPEYVGKSSEEIITAKTEGKEITEPHERIWVAYTGDTTIDFLKGKIFKGDKLTIHVLVMELTFLDRKHQEPGECEEGDKIPHHSHSEDEEEQDQGQEKRKVNLPDATLVESKRNNQIHQQSHPLVTMHKSSPKGKISVAQTDNDGGAFDVSDNIEIDINTDAALVITSHPSDPSATIIQRPAISAAKKDGNVDKHWISYLMQQQREEKVEQQGEDECCKNTFESRLNGGGHVVLDDFLDYYHENPQSMDHIDNIVFMHISQRYSQKQINRILTEKLPKQLMHKIHVIVP